MSLRKPRSAYSDGFGILNPYGDMWTSDIFATEDEAREYVRRFWQFATDKGGDLSRYRIVKARQRTTVITERSKP